MHKLLYVPQLIGYVRLMLALSSLLNVNEAPAFCWMYMANMSLDFFDGLAARKLGQQTRLGEFLDVVCDNFTRTIAYAVCCTLYPPGVLALLVPLACIEWLVFACTHAQAMLARQNWKAMRSAPGRGQAERTAERVPAFIEYMFSNGFKNPLGALVIGALSGLPIFLYADAHLAPVEPVRRLCWRALGCVLVAGRVCGLAAEAYAIRSYVAMLLASDGDGDGDKTNEPGDPKRA